jgi:hypothetical protein
MELNALTALSPLDGRYGSRLNGLRALGSEAGLVRQRVAVEVAWFKALAAHPDFGALPQLAADDRAFLDQLVEDFSSNDAAAVKAIEKTTNHDVKAVEYWLKQQMANRPRLAPYLEFVHFACTSEDINNLSWALIIKASIEHQLDPMLSTLDRRLQQMAIDTPTCRCFRAPTARPRRQPPWARNWPTSCFACAASAGAQPGRAQRQDQWCGRQFQCPLWLPARTWTGRPCHARWSRIWAWSGTLIPPRSNRTT